jgi:hypothetical protein
MELIGWYFLFAFTTGLTGSYELAAPALSDLAILAPKHNMLEYRWLSYAVFTLVFTIAAPLVFLMCIIPSFSTWFREALVTELTRP